MNLLNLCLENTYKMAVYFRADGNSEIGLGHVMRCVAIAEILAKTFDCFFLINNPSPQLEQILKKVCNIILISTDKSPNAKIEITPHVMPNDIIVIDGYNFDSTYQKNIKEYGCFLVCIDDLQKGFFWADIIINHGAGLFKKNYIKAPYTKIFLGPQFAIIRKEFHKKTILKNSKRILITYGGADLENFTLKTISQIIENYKQDYYFDIVIGTSYMHKIDLAYFNKDKKINIHENIDSKKMASLMRKSQICIASPSTVAFEYLSSSTGTLIVQKTALNQKHFFNYLIKNNLAIPFDDFLIHGIDTFKKINIEHREKLFDGKSQERILEIFKGI